MNIELSGLAVLTSIIFLGILIVSGILVSRYYYHRYKNIANEGLRDVQIPPVNRTKNRKIDVIRLRSKIMGMGLICSLTFAIITMSWTIYQRPVDPTGYAASISDDETEAVTLMTPPPPSPPPSPSKVLIEIINDKLIDEDLSDRLDATIFDHDVISENAPPPAESVFIPPPPPPLPEPIGDMPDEIYVFLEEMPLFDQCPDKKCSDESLMKYFYQQIKYPSPARENGIEGRVTGEFVVEKNGKISEIKMLRGIGAGCDEEVLKAINSMNKSRIMWTPGRQRGRPVRVLYRLPVTFKLDH